MPGLFPAQIKHYALKRLLGQGGMGMVVEGEDRRDGSRVAVKLLFPHLAATDPSYLDRFEREAHVAALLRSPYTVHLLDFGTEGNQSFLVMEFVDGNTLAQMLSQGPLPPDEALRIAGEVARALEEAGARGVVHRDIKPENILLDERGRVKVTDFGIARSTAAPGITMTGGFVGTPAFAAPEQVEGKVDHRTDIYSLGVTLYTALTGRQPFQGKSPMDTLFLHQTAPLPMEPLAHLPDPVQSLVRRCMEKDPLDRYQTAAELTGAIDRARQVLARNSRGAGDPVGWRPTPSTPSGRITGPATPCGTGPDDRTSVDLVRPGRRPPGPNASATGAPAVAGQSAQPPVATPAAPGPPAAGVPFWKRPVVMLAALAVVVGLAAFGAVVAVAAIGGGGDDDDEPPAGTGSPSPTAATTTPSPTEVAGRDPTEATTASPTATPTGPFAPILGIRLFEGRYQVAFTHSGFEYATDGNHVHFFFDTIRPEDAGAPASDENWFDYDGGSPFTRLTTDDRPDGARRLCILVARGDHTVVPGSGNCFNLPN